MKPDRGIWKLQLAIFDPYFLCKPRKPDPIDNKMLLTLHIFRQKYFSDAEVEINLLRRSNYSICEFLNRILNL